MIVNTLRRFRPLRLGLAAGLGFLAAPAWAQSADPAPYLHTPNATTPSLHPPLHHTVKPAPKPKHVPVVGPHRPGPPRHAARAPAGSKHAVAKAAPPPVVAKTAPKKPAPPPVPADVGTSSGLHLPRYAALKTDEVNMRAGPGDRYPIIWTYQRRDLPVKIEREFDIWRLVEDMDGIKGWMQQGTLAGHRSFVIIGTDDRTLRSDASDTADAVAVLKPGVVGRLRACDASKDWCQVQVQDYRGWLKRSDFWGIDPAEAITP